MLSCNSFHDGQSLNGSLVRAELSKFPHATDRPLSVIDLMRLISLFSPSPTASPPTAQQTMLEALFAGCNWDKLMAQNSEPMSKSRETNTLLTLRALANSFHIGIDGVVYGSGGWLMEVSAMPKTRQSMAINVSTRY